MTSGRRVAIAGAALSDCARVDVQSNFELHYQGTSRALADAGLTKDAVQGFMSTGLGNLPPVEVAEYLGLQPTWVDSTPVVGGSWEVMVENCFAGNTFVL